MGLSRHNFLPCIVLVLVSSLLLVNAQAPTPTPSADSAGTARPQPSCGFNGDDNAYGAGIRIGLYIQWITSAIAYNFVPEEASNMRVVNICFQLANFAGLLYITFSRGVGQPSGELYAVECWILLCFCIGGICSSRSRASNANGELSQTNNFSLYKATALGGLIQLALGAAMVYYGIWFVYVGMDTMQHTSCSRYAFFFSRVDLYGWFRTFLKVSFTITAFGVFITLVLLASATIFCLQSMPFTQWLHMIFGFQLNIGPNSSPEHGVKDDGTPVTRLTNISLSFAIFMFIISTELVIKYNNIQDVNNMGSTGQLFPIVTASSSFVSVLYQFVIKTMRGDYELASDHNIQLCCFKMSGEGGDASVPARTGRRKARSAVLMA